jgi:hypothetical protein
MGYYDDDYASEYTDEQTGPAQGRGGYSTDYGYEGDSYGGNNYGQSDFNSYLQDFYGDDQQVAGGQDFSGAQQVSGDGEATQYGTQPTQYGDSGYMGTGMTFQEYYGQQIMQGGSKGSGPGYHGGGGGGSYSGPKGELDLSGIDLDLPEYNAPEEDPAIYKHEYETVYQRTKAPVEQGVSEAIMSSKSLDNPMARMDFVRKALSGYGEALTGIASAAHSAAQEEAARQYANQMQEYQMQYKAEYAEAVAAYEKELQAAISNWEAGTGGDDGGWGNDPWYGYGENYGIPQQESKIT